MTAGKRGGMMGGMNSQGASGSNKEGKIISLCYCYRGREEAGCQVVQGDGRDKSVEGPVLGSGHIDDGGGQ
jgi:hypothetical protein